MTIFSLNDYGVGEASPPGESLKCELIYLKAFEDGQHLAQEVSTWFRWYNRQRPHQSLNYRTPDEIYYQTG